MAGDHKCPICPATFTRPQHVGRHLRSHTGDRPYECKECPLRFARSDLLSRHVNKAHRSAEAGAEPKKESKKGKRKSLPSSARQATDESSGSGSGEGSGQVHQHPGHGEQPVTGPYTSETSRRASFGQATHLQAQALFPHHPLLNGSPSPMSPNTAGVNGLMGNGMMASPVDTYSNIFASSSATVGGFPQGIPTPMTWSNSDMGASSSSMTRNESSFSSYDYGIKKKACDQCNHSKQRCDFAHPCVRCTTRNVGCTYNKPAKSRTTSLTPGMSYQGMPVSLSPVSSFSMSPHTSTSPLTHQQGYPSQQAQYSTSPINTNQYPLPPQLGQQASLGVWPDANSFDLSHIDINLANSIHSSQAALGMYVPVAPVQMPQTSNANGVPIFQQYGQIANGQGTSPPLQFGLSSTPSLTPSHTTSPSSMDEPAERKPSLIGSIASMDHSSSIPVKSDSYSSEYSNPVIPHVSPDAKQFALPPQSAVEQVDLSSFQWNPSTYTIDPRYQIRQSHAQSDDEGDQGPTLGNLAMYNDADEPITHGRRRSSLGVWAEGLNRMTLQDGSIAPQAMLPDPYTAVQVAHQAANLRPTFPMTTVMEGTEPSKMPSASDVKDYWKQYMREPTGSTPQLEKREGESSVASTSSRPGLERGLSKSNSAPDLTSPSVLANTFSYDRSDAALAHANAHPHAQPMQHVSTMGGSDPTTQNWQNQIHQRQAGFTMQPGGRFGRNSTGGATSMLPPASSNSGSNNARPVASIMQYSGALQQTLAPERAPSFGLTPNTEKANPTATFPRTPSKLSQRTTFTSATARPGNKRLPSQTLVPEAKKRSSSFSVYDDQDAGILGVAEDESRNGWNMAALQGMANFQPGPGYGGIPMPGYATAHGRSASLNGITPLEGWDLSMFGNQLAYQHNQVSVPGPPPAPNMPAPMAPN